MDNMFIGISEMTIDDVSGICEIEKECFSSPWSEKSVFEELDNKCAVFLVAKLGNNIVGYIGSYFVSGEIYITNIAVSGEYRNRGIASQLLKTVIKMAKNEKAEFITLEVRESNSAAISLYESFNFQRVGLRENFYSFPTENAVLMTLFFS